MNAFDSVCSAALYCLKILPSISFSLPLPLPILSAAMTATTFPLTLTATHQGSCGRLGGEKSRWSEESERYSIDYNNLVGDLLVGSGIVAYLGAFTLEFRSQVCDTSSA